MDKVVIEVPEGQTAKVNKQSDGNVLVTFEKAEHWKSIKSIEDAFNYLEKKGILENFRYEYDDAPVGSYSEKIAAYRIVVAALTDNEKSHLTTGEYWRPVVQFCVPGKEKGCYGSEILGTIESEGQKFTVVGGGAVNVVNKGLGFLNSYTSVSRSWANISLLSISRLEIAKHISKYFGRLLFEILYGGVNCDWKWID